MFIFSLLADFFTKLNSDFSLLYVLLRIIIIYIYSIFLLRINKRFRLESSMEFILIIVIGGILSAPIVGGSTLVQAITESILLVALHKLFAYLTFHSKRFSRWIKGDPIILFQNGTFNGENLRKHFITVSEVEEAWRDGLHSTNFKDILETRLDHHTGKIIFIQKSEE